MINEKLHIYLKKHILPKYDSYDKGHNRDHILEVVQGSVELAHTQEVDMDMVLTAAYFHDLGLCEGRDIHHLASARMLRGDEFIRGYFSSEQIEIIAQAIEDHRASAKSAPRSIYGEILSSADRIIIIDTIIVRSLYHSEKHHPELSFEQHLERIYIHIMDKYGDGGYLRIPILTEKNREGLATLRAKLQHQEEFKRYCTHVTTKAGARKILYVDMDGVLVDFQSAIDALDDATRKEYEGRLDDVPHLFRDMKPLLDAIESYRLLAEKFETYILTTAPWNNPTAMDDKKAWVKQHLGDVAHKRLIITHQKNLLRGDYLIDDRTLRGAAEFDGEHIHFTTERFPNWASVVEYLSDKW